jgi:hypothetical protein
MRYHIYQSEKNVKNIEIYCTLPPNLLGKLCTLPLRSTGTVNIKNCCSIYIYIFSL